MCFPHYLCLLRLGDTAVCLGLLGLHMRLRWLFCSLLLTVLTKSSPHPSNHDARQDPTVGMLWFHLRVSSLYSENIGLTSAFLSRNERKAARSLAACLISTCGNCVQAYSTPFGSSCLKDSTCVMMYQKCMRIHPPPCAGRDWLCFSLRWRTLWKPHGMEVQETPRETGCSLASSETHRNWL